MNDKWMIQGSEYTNCNCAFGCPCQFNSPTTNGYCEALACAELVEGHFNEVSLDGVKYAMLLHWPGEIAEGNGQCQLIIDENANEDQRDAIKKITAGESTAPGSTHYFVFASTMSKVHETLVKPIDLTIDVEARQAHCRIEDMVESKGSPLINPFSGEEARAAIHLPNGFEYTIAEMGVGNTKVSGAIDLDLKDSYGQFNILHMNQDGVVR